MRETQKARRERVLAVLQKDWKYSIKYNYHDSSLDRCYCDENDYCRCGTIEDMNILEVNVSDIANEVVECIDDDFLEYCLDRIIRLAGLHDPCHWEHTPSPGYYGEEVGTFKIREGKVSDIMTHVENLLKTKSDKGAIEFILNHEYGYLLTGIKDLRWSIVGVRKKDVVVGRQDHYVRLERGAIEQYRDLPSPLKHLPRGICVMLNERICLIDGYHRFAASSNGVHDMIVGQ